MLKRITEKPIVLIVGEEFGFPQGYGATNRVFHYAKGLTENDFNVFVWCLKPSEDDTCNCVLNDQVKGYYEGIDFEYLCGNTLRLKDFWGRRFQELRSIWKLYLMIQHLKSTRRKIKAMLLYSDNFFWVLMIMVISKLTRIKCILEVCEFPFVRMKKNIITRLQFFIYTHYMFRMMDGFIPISTFLEEFITSLTNKKCMFLRIPILVDTKQIIHCHNITGKTSVKTIIYVGHLHYKKEINDLLNIFSRVAAEQPSVKLQIVGGLDDNVLIKSYMLYARELGLDRHIEFTGHLDRKRLTNKLSQCYLMVLPRSNALFSRAGFPTKLAECLAAGRPVITSNTGDLSLYLKDGYNAYLIPPDDISAFVKRIIYALNHAEEVDAVGMRGRYTAIEFFDYRIQCKRLGSFIEKINRADSQE